MEKDDLEIERQRIELERQKLEFERSRLEFEKSKNKKEDGNISINQKTNFNILGLISSVILAVSSFLPWAESTASGFGASFSASASGMQTGHGIIVVICALACITLIFMRNKFVFIPGALAVIIGLTAITGMGSFTSSYGGASFKAGFAIGPILTIISSIIVTLSSLIKINSTGSNSEVFIALTKKFKFELLLFLASIFVIIPLLNEIDYPSGFFDFLITLGLYFGIPAFIFRYFKMTYSFNVILALGSYIIILFIQSILIRNVDSYLYSTFGDNMQESIFNGKYWFNLLLYPLLILAAIIDFRKIKGFNTQTLVNKTRFVLKPFISQFFLFIPLFGYFIFYSFSRHYITSEEIVNFEKNNSFLVGDWYFTNHDESKIFKLQFDNVSAHSNFDMTHEGVLNCQLEYSVNNLDNEQLWSGILDTNIYFNNKLELPLNFTSGLTVQNYKNDKIDIILNYSDGSSLKTKCFKSPNLLLSKVNGKMKKIFKSNLEGAYTGFFADGEITLWISKIDFKTGEVNGKNIFKGNERILKGKVEFINDFALFILKEPGDQEFDGVFEFKILESDPQCITGYWKSNTGELERDYVLKK
jgi:hypothetical protein